MSLWWPFGTHSYLLLPLTLAQSHRFFSTLAGICLFKKKTTKKNCTNSPSHTSFIFALPLAHSHSVQHQSHSLILKSDKSRQDFYIHKKGERKKDNTHRLTQYMQSEAVFFDGKAFTHGRRGIDTEIGRTLLPMRRFLPGNWERVGELQKRFSWRRFQKTSNKKQTKKMQLTAYRYIIISSPFYKGDEGALEILVHVYKYLSCMQSSLFNVF